MIIDLVEEYIKLYRGSGDEIFDKYKNTRTLQALKGKGMFCGMDHVGIPMLRPKVKYTRYPHSLVVCYGTYSLTDDPIQALAGLFHNVGTKRFAHANSFAKGEGKTQENDELNVRSVLLKDKELLEYLKEDKIDLDEVCDASKYPVVDKDRPALCMDRLDGILSACLMWTGSYNLGYIKDLLTMVCVFDQKYFRWYSPMTDRLESYNIELGLNELGSKRTYEDFFRAIESYSRMMQTKENRYAMALLGDILNVMEENKILTGNEQSESEAIYKMMRSEYRNLWVDFTRLSEVKEVDSNTEGYIITPEAKIRYSFPLVFDGTAPTEIFGICGERYIDHIKLDDLINRTQIPLKGNLSIESEKILMKYRKDMK